MPTAPYKPLGRTNVNVSSIGLGCMGMSDFYGSADDARSVDLIRYALDQGMNFFDTADMYGPHTNERLLGRALAGRRDEAVIATKFGVMRTPEGGWLGINGQPDYVRSSCEGSLARLGVDTIDLYYQHRVDPATPIEETVGAMAELVTAGKVRFLGLSEADPDQIRRAHAVHPITAVQTELSLWSREAELGVIEACAELGITFVAYSPLGRGFLSGAIRTPDDFDPTDFRRHNPRFQGENFARNLALVDSIRALAADKGVTAAQLALAWVFTRGEHVVAIPGTTRRERFDENQAARSVSFTDAELSLLDSALPIGAAAGTRY